jgi:hypothetical protein
MIFSKKVHQIRRVGLSPFGDKQKIHWDSLKIFSKTNYYFRRVELLKSPYIFRLEYIPASCQYI